MKIKSFSSLITMSMALSVGVACQSARKPSAAVPAVQKTPPPAVHSSSPTLHSHTEETGATDDKSKGSSSAAVAAAKQAGSPPAKPEPPVDKTADLIAKVENLYQAGQKEYANGHNDLAKHDFSQAFDLLQGSPAEVRADARFKRELDRVLDGMNSLELTALQRDNASEQEQSEPAPIDEANEAPETPADPNLKAKAAAEVKATHSDLPLMMTDEVARYIDYFSNRGRGTLEHGLERSGRYRDMIEQILKEEGVPQDLIYLAQAESGFHPYAVSRVGARGIWQFMASRARAYDLHRNAWVDERQDPEKATRAAAHHLKDLYNQFGDWYLAMAAYNSGPGTVQSAVKRTGYADFWELYHRNVLPRETRNYVPIILAETIMAKNPEQYGLESVAPDPELKYDTIKIDYPVDLRLVAECVGASTEDLQDLNPSLLRMVTPKGQFDLHVPVGTTQEYQEGIAQIPPDMRVWWRLHQVEPGDTLMTLARRYHTTVHAITEANQVGDDADISAGQRLIIPIAPGRVSPGDIRTYAKRLTIYHIRKGDTVETVSDRLGIPSITIRRWNHLRGSSLTGRRVLYVHLPVSPGAPGAVQYTVRTRSSRRLQAANGATTRRHTVKPGETLYSIASSYNTSVKAIQKNNAKLRDIRMLRPGMVLLIPPQQ